MLTSKKFAANLTKIRTTDEQFRVLVAESLAFAIFHARNHGQKTPYMQLCEAVPAWLKKDLNSVPVAKVAIKRQITEENAEHEASFHVAEWFASHEERKVLRAANRKARVTAPKAEEAAAEEPQEAEVIESTVTDITTDCALIVDCQVVEITEAEANLLAAYLQQLRHPALKVA